MAGLFGLLYLSLFAASDMKQTLSENKDYNKELQKARAKGEDIFATNYGKTYETKTGQEVVHSILDNGHHVIINKKTRKIVRDYDQIKEERVKKYKEQERLDAIESAKKYGLLCYHYHNGLTMHKYELSTNKPISTSKIYDREQNKYRYYKTYYDDTNEGKVFTPMLDSKTEITKEEWDKLLGWESKY